MTRTVLIFIAVLLTVLPVAAQESPRFFIERIEVRNAKRVSTDVVIAESRLSPGREYSESELRDASTRLSRLPFLLSVDFALEKGTERGKHVLVLSIVETKPFFFLLDGRFRHFERSADGSIDDRLDRDSSESVAGFRWFSGSKGVFHVGLYTNSDLNDLRYDFASIGVGYTRYDLFGSRAFATLNLKRSISGVAEGAFTPQLVVGLPLSANQTLTLETDQTRWSRFDRIQQKDLEYGERAHVLRWAYDTTDNPFFPMRGSVLSVSPLIVHSDVRGLIEVYRIDPQTGEQVLVDEPTVHSDTRGVEVVAERFWELSERNSLSTGVEALLARREVSTGIEFRPFEGSESRTVGVVRLGFVHSLWDRERRKDGDSLIEVTASYGDRRDALRTYVWEVDDFEEREERFVGDTRQLSASWVRRSSWGTFRLGAGYAW